MTKRAHTRCCDFRAKNFSPIPSPSFQLQLEEIYGVWDRRKVKYQAKHAIAKNRIWGELKTLLSLV
eukprot:2440005-Amphidinium_carterae.1